MEGVCKLLVVEERQGSLVGDEVYVEFRFGGVGLFVVDWVIRYGGIFFGRIMCAGCGLGMGCAPSWEV